MQTCPDRRSSRPYPGMIPAISMQCPVPLPAATHIYKNRVAMRHDDVPRNNHQRMVQTVIKLGAGLPTSVGWLLGGFAFRVFEQIFCIRLMLRSPEAVHLLHLQLHSDPYPATSPAPPPPPPAAAPPRQLCPCALHFWVFGHCALRALTAPLGIKNHLA